MSTANAFLHICITSLALIHIQSVGSHEYKRKPIGKLMRGTFASYDEQSGDETARLYVCKARKGKYYWTVVQNYSPSSDCCQNYVIGNGVFSQSGIDFHDNVISNDQCFYQVNGNAREVTSCEFDVVDLCDVKEVTLSGLFEGTPVSREFVKISGKDELLGNDHLAPYQCGIPWDGDLSVEDVYPIAFLSGPLYWIGQNEDGREIQTYLEEAETYFDSCWTYIEPDGTFTGIDGPQVVEQFNWDKKHQLIKWNPPNPATSTTTQDPDPGCTGGSQISIRVNRDTLLISWQCADGISGAGYLSHKNDDYPGQCPVFPDPMTTMDDKQAVIAPMMRVRPSSSRYNADRVRN